MRQNILFGICLVLLSSLPLSTVCLAEPEMTFTKIVDTNTPPPVPSEEFTAFKQTAIDGENVAFQGDIKSQHYNVYIYRDGVINEVAKYGQEIPPPPGGAFRVFANPDIVGGRVVFKGDDLLGWNGIYIYEDGQLNMLVDPTISVPGQDEETKFGGFASASLDGTNVAFFGASSVQSVVVVGLYKKTLGGGMYLVADTTTLAPGGTGNFVDFGQAAYMMIPRINGGSVVFYGVDSDDRRGLYSDLGGTLHVIADTNTQMPGETLTFSNFPDFNIGDGIIVFIGDGDIYSSIDSVIESEVRIGVEYTLVSGENITFTSFSQPCVNGEMLAFLGYAHNNDIMGIYVMADNRLMKIIEVGESLNGKWISDLSFSLRGLSENRVVFITTFQNGSYAIYIATITGFGESALELVCPNGGEHLLAQDQYFITWNSIGDIEAVKIEFSSDNGGNWEIIQSDTQNDGIFEWLVPNVTSEQCLIRLSAASDHSVSDVSDSTFTISTTKTLTVLQPNGAERLNSGSTFLITWNSTGAINGIALEYSYDNGTDWQVIDPSAANDGEYEWLVPYVSSEQCLVRISDVDDFGMHDISDGVFTIRDLNIIEGKPWFSIDTGSAKVSSGDDFELRGVIGQAENSVLTGGDFMLKGGFLFELTGCGEGPGIRDGLVGHWRFNEGAGQIAHDASGNANDGTIYGATWEPNGISGQALSFDDDDEYVQVPDSDSLDILDELTLAMWVCRKIDSQTYVWLANKGCSATCSYGLLINEGDGFAFALNNEDHPPRSSVQGLTTIHDDEWYFVTGTYDRDRSKQKLFVNGILDGTATYSETLLTSSAPLIMGKKICLGTPYALNGLIDEVRIYNRALSDAEIKCLYDNPAGDSCYSCMVPDVVGMPQSQAEEAIVSAGFSVGDVTYGCSRTVPAGHVISQDPNAQTWAITGSPIDLVISVELTGDFDNDRDVDANDLKILVQYWLQNEPLVDIAPPPDGDDMADMKDFAAFAENWLRCTD